mgnify:CR=1 FL=1
MKELLKLLMAEYQRLMNLEEKFREWQRDNPKLYPWEYKGQRVSRARMERIGIMIRQTMRDYEREL